MTSPGGGTWVGRSISRLEDPYLLSGRGRFVDDLDPKGLLHLAIVRSELASAGVASIDCKAAREVEGVVAVLDAADLGPVAPLRAALVRPEFVATDMPVLASGRVRHVGEPLAVVVATSRYAAEDGAEAVVVEYEPRDAVASAGEATRPGAPLVHDHVARNVVVEVELCPTPEVAERFAGAEHVVEVDVSSGRLSALPLEGRCCLAFFDERDGQLVLHSSTQIPHTVRTAVASSLGIDEHAVRVVAPDVGGGFGQKCVVAREEVLVAAVARLLRRPVKWSEDRRESLIAGFQAREQRYRLRAAFDRAGRVLGLEADVVCDVGAYSCYPVTCGVEVLMAANELPGPYKIDAYRVRARGIATNKAPIAPFRGVSRPQAALALEHLMDEAGRVTGLGPVEVRLRNLPGAEEFPFRTVMGASYDAGSYRESVTSCAEAAGERIEALRDEARARGRLIGLGLGLFVEPTAYGTRSFGARKMSMVPGYEQATVRVDPTGAVLVMAGTHSHGQGHATTYAQIVADQLGVPPERVHVREGDTELVPHGWGTFASRSIVSAGGAVHRASGFVLDEMRAIAAHLLEAPVDDVELRDGRLGVRGSPASAIAVEEIARVAHHAADRLPPGLGRGLEATADFDSEGTYSNAAHGAVVEVDPETGQVALVRYVVVEDCGVMINPMVVDGQVCGGVAQGVGSALLEQLVYDEGGQPLTTSLMDYLVPAATDVPTIEIRHLVTPTDRSATGAKGMGEGGTIGAPAAVLNAVNDALAGRGTVTRLPIRPADVLAALAGAGAAIPAPAPSGADNFEVIT